MLYSHQRLFRCVVFKFITNINYIRNKQFNKLIKSIPFAYLKRNYNLKDYQKQWKKFDTIAVKYFENTTKRMPDTSKNVNFKHNTSIVLVSLYIALSMDKIPNQETYDNIVGLLTHCMTVLIVYLLANQELMLFTVVFFLKATIESPEYSIRFNSLYNKNETGFVVFITIGIVTCVLYND